jgi:hypothetical protein
LSKKWNKKNKQHHPPNDHQKPTCHYDMKWPSIYPVRIEPSPEDENRYSAEQLYKARQLRTARTLNWITGFAAGVGLFGLAILYGQLDILKGQLDHTDKQFSMYHRPWVNIAIPVKVDGPLVFSESGAQIPITYSITNGGTAPALGTTLIFTHALVVGTMPGPAEARQAINCGKPSPIADLSNETGVLILPGQNGGEIHRLLKTLDAAHFTKTVPTDVWAPVCILYKDESGDYHGTGFLLVFYSHTGQSQILPIGSVEGQLSVSGWGHIEY